MGKLRTFLAGVFCLFISNMAIAENVAFVTDRSIAAFNHDLSEAILFKELTPGIVDASFARENGNIALLYSSSFKVYDSALEHIFSAPLEKHQKGNLKIAILDAANPEVLVWSGSKAYIYDQTTAPDELSLDSPITDVGSSEELGFVIATKNKIYAFNGRNSEISEFGDADPLGFELITRGRPIVVSTRQLFDAKTGQQYTRAQSNRPLTGFADSTDVLLASNSSFRQTSLAGSGSNVVKEVHVDRTHVRGRVVSSVLLDDGQALLVWNDLYQVYAGDQLVVEKTVSDVDTHASTFVHASRIQLDSTPPEVTITYPEPGFYWNVPWPYIRVEFFEEESGIDETSFAGWINGNREQDLRCSIFDQIGLCSPWAPLEDGSYQYSVAISDNAGNQSNPVSIDFTVDTTPPPIANIELIEYARSDDGEITLSGSAGSVEPFGEVIIRDISTGDIVATVRANEDGSFTATFSGPEGGEYEIVVKDFASNTSDGIVYSAPIEQISIEIFWPNQSRFYMEDGFHFAGRVVGPLPQNWGITINGEVAPHDARGYFAIDSFPHEVGNNKLELRVNGRDGLLHKEIMDVEIMESRAATSLSYETFYGSNEIPTYTYSLFTLDFINPLNAYSIDWGIDGTIDEQRQGNLALMQRSPVRTYSSRGYHFERHIFTDSDGSEANVIIPLYFEEPQYLVDLATGIHGTLIDAIANADETVIESLFHEAVAESYAAKLVSIPAENRVALLEKQYKISLTASGQGWANFYFKAASEDAGFFMQMNLGYDGRWRIGKL